MKRTLALLFVVILIALAPAPPAWAAGKDPKAVEIAERMMAATGGILAWDAQRYVRFVVEEVRDDSEVTTHRHWWDRETGRYRLEGENEEGREYRVLFNTKKKDEGKVWVEGDLLEGEKAADYIGRARTRFIHDTYWLLMPWMWLDAGVGLKHEGERELNGTLYDLVGVSYADVDGLTPGDHFWAYVSRETGRMERWATVLPERDGGSAKGEPTDFAWMDWKDAGGGVLLSTRKVRLGGRPSLVIRYPLVQLDEQAPDVAFNPILRPASAELPPVAPTGVSPTEAGVDELLIVLNKSDHTAAFVEMKSMSIVRKVPTGIAPHEAAVSPDGKTLYVANYGAKEPGSTISEIDIPAGTVRRMVDLGEHRRPHGIAVGRDGSVWVTTEASKSVLRLSAEDLRIEQVYKTDQEVTHMIALTPDGKRAFTANIGSGSVSMIDVETGKVTSLATGSGAEGIDISPDGTELWVAHRNENDVKILDPWTFKVVDRIRTAKFPIRVRFTPDGQTVLVSCAQSNQLMVIDRESREEIVRLTLDDVPIGIQVSRDGKFAFVANTQADRVTLVDLQGLRVMGSFSTGREPDGMTWASW